MKLCFLHLFKKLETIGLKLDSLLANKYFEGESLLIYLTFCKAEIF